MKRICMILIALMLVCTASLSLGESKLSGLLARIGNEENPVAFTLANTEYGVLEPMEGYMAIFPELLARAELTPADASEAPEGEYVVLNFTEENIRFDFFYGDETCLRQVNPDGSEEYFRVQMPENLSSAVMIMEAELDALADMHGLVPPVEAVMPEEGWVLDSVNGAVWQSDRASLRVFLEDTENYKVQILWGSSAFETREWVYGCEYDAEAQTLNAAYVVCDDLTYDENGEETRTNVYEAESEAVFALNEEGGLVLRNAGDEQLEGKTFEMTEIQGGTRMTGGIEDGCYLLLVETEDEDTGWSVLDPDEEDPVIKVTEAVYREDGFYVRCEAGKDGTGTLTLVHDNDDMITDQVCTFDLVVRDGAIEECVGGSSVSSPEDEELEEVLCGEWTEAETQFTRMTITRNPDSGFDVRIVSPVSHEAYVFTATVGYDCYMEALVYHNGAFYPAPIENTDELGDPEIVNETGMIHFAADSEENLSLVWTNEFYRVKTVAFVPVE